MDTPRPKNLTSAAKRRAAGPGCGPLITWIGKLIGGSRCRSRTPRAVAGADACVVSPTHPPVRTAVSQRQRAVREGRRARFEAGGTAVRATAAL